MADHQHQHQHQHQHAHQAHGHGHGHGHGGHDHGDAWSGEEYLARPGVKETAKISNDAIVYALTAAGKSDAEIKAMDVLEIGSGAGAVSTHLIETFASLQSIDTSPSMLLAYSTLHPTSPSPTITHSLHALSPASPQIFSSAEPLPCPSKDHPDRKVAPPRARFDLAVANLVLHHVDQVDKFMQGAVGLLKSGGWLVVTEFGKKEGENTMLVEGGKTLENGSVNAPGVYLPTFTPDTIAKLFKDHGLVDVHAEFRGKLPVFPEEDNWPECLLVRGRKP
ncbi:hypothetical protein IAT38_008413 [Cryptococcus sp. DSM 104549]